MEVHQSPGNSQTWPWSSDEDDKVCVEALMNYEAAAAAEHSRINNLDLNENIKCNRMSTVHSQSEEEVEIKVNNIKVEQSDVRVERSIQSPSVVGNIQDQEVPQKSDPFRTPEQSSKDIKWLRAAEKTDSDIVGRSTQDECSNNNFIPNTPCKPNVKSFFRTKRTSDRLKNHAIYHLNSTSLSDEKTTDMEKSTRHSLLKDSDSSEESETDSEIVMGYNMRDFVLMTSDSSLDPFPESPIDHKARPEESTNDEEQSSSSTDTPKVEKKDKIVYDPPIMTEKKVAYGISRARNGLRDSESEFVKDDLEPDSTSCSSDDRESISKISKSVKRQILKSKKRNGNMSSSESSDDQNSKQKHRRSPLKRKPVKKTRKNLKLIVEDSDGSPKPKRNKQSRYMTRSKSTKYNNNESDDSSGKSKSPVDTSADSDSADNSSCDDKKRYTRSRANKPGRKYRYRNIHTGETDKESEDAEENESESGTDTDSSGEASSEISDPDVEEEEEEKACIVCKTLGNINVEDVDGRFKHDQAYWCKCGHCEIFSPIMRDYDRICCREMVNVVEFMEEEVEGGSQEEMCVTSHPRFLRDVIDFGAFLRTQKNTFFHPDTATENKKVYHSLRSYLRWIYDRLGERNRIMLPACVHSIIRKTHLKDPNNPYFKPFKPLKICVKRLHCRAAM